MFMFMLMLGEPAAWAVILRRCSWRARALCMMSEGRLLALGGGLLTLFKSPVTLELGLIWAEFWGSDTVLSEGTLRGNSLPGEEPGRASELELGGSRGVLASDESSSEPGDAGPLGRYSSAGVTGSELSA